jgi:Uma2 family endonuclease
MEMLSPPAAHLLATEKVRPLKRVEYDRLVAAGCFEDERVELLFGLVVEMSPPSPEHSESVYVVQNAFGRLLGDRARVYCQSPFAATDDSEPQPDVYVTSNGTYWKEHPTRSYLVAEVARSSLRHDSETKALLYATSAVDEYWIVNHPEECIDVHRDPANGVWRSITRFGRGERVAMLAFPDVSIAVDDVLPPRE